jgi:DNA invertase Pin-like site-specific DNA recombinase
MSSMDRSSGGDSMQHEIRSKVDNGATGLRAAQYVRMSTDQQRYSTENQADAIAAYAALRGITIVRFYADEGRSGLSLERRDALKELIGDVRSGRANFQLILVYDISRWGRFQDADESAYYEFICKEAGIHVRYCAEPFENDGSLTSTILKNMKRAMAGEYSRELSAKVFIGQCRIVTLGFWRGGPPGYGLRRQMLDEHGTPKALLEKGQCKSLKTDRVILVPGPPLEVKVIRRIFTDFAVQKKTRTEIAVELNAEGILNARGRPWIMQTIDDVLRNEKYIGHNVYNRGSFKLQQKHVFNPPDMWIRRDNAFKAIVPPVLFAKAQKALVDLEHGKTFTDQQLLDRLAALLRRKGHLTMQIMQAAKDVPDWTVYQRRFGSIMNAYKRIGFKPKARYDYAANGAKIDAIICSAAEEIAAYVQRRGGSATFLAELYLLTVNGSLTMVIAVAWSVFDGALGTGGRRSRRWEVRKIKYGKSDLTLVIRLGAANDKVQDYFLAPTPNLALTSDRKKLRISDRVFGQFQHDRFDAVLEALYSFSKGNGGWEAPVQREIGAKI